MLARKMMCPPLPLTLPLKQLSPSKESHHAPPRQHLALPLNHAQSQLFARSRKTRVLQKGSKTHPLKVTQYSEDKSISITADAILQRTPTAQYNNDSVSIFNFLSEFFCVESCHCDLLYCVETIISEQRFR